MIKVYILRHEEAGAAGGGGGLDRDRVLTAEGEKSIAASARGMARIGIKPDLIWTSPYPRASQTATIAARELGLEDRVSERIELAPGADPREVARLLEAEAAEATVMLVGHNPDLERLIGWLISPRDDAAVNLKKGALALIHVETPVAAGCGSLRWLLIPGQMGQLGG